MKKLISILATSTFIAILFSSNTYAQNMYASNSGNAIHTTVSPASEESKQPANVISVISHDDIVAANPTVISKFSLLFPGATNLQWTGSKNNFWVSFLNKGRKCRASFTSNGKMNYAITDCLLEQLPGSFRKEIKKDYSDYNFYNAIEINAYNALTYQVVLENANSFTTLKYTSEGVEKIQQVKKTAN